MKISNIINAEENLNYKNKLNPKFWIGTELKPIVKLQLLKIAKDFIKELGINSIDIKDITLSGSNAAYNYTPHSDLDLHLLVDFNKLDNTKLYQTLFDAKKTIYNFTHSIKIYDVPVELYVQDINKPVISLGEYSVLTDKWLNFPTKQKPSIDERAFEEKYLKLLKVIKYALKVKNIKKIDKILKKIKQYRQAGLDKYGEFGPENLAFKVLRSQGYLSKLYELRDKLHSEKLSIESKYATEDFDPNDSPPGPEFKPTMPKGTVRVDVSDVYDWYKLGQHISNMKGLGKHDFGKGPPSTILSFGDEDIEHKYIQDLLKTGLTTTDIDPPAHGKIKGQKIDRNYNVENKKYNK